MEPACRSGRCAALGSQGTLNVHGTDLIPAKSPQCVVSVNQATNYNFAVEQRDITQRSLFDFLG